MIYPVYRREKKMRKFHKVISENEVLTLRVTNHELFIIHSKSGYRVAEALLDSRTMEITKDEFVTEFKKADTRLFNSMPEA